MQLGKTIQEEISALEAEIGYHKKLLDKSISDNDELEKVKSIFHDLKLLSDKLDQLKNNLLNKV
jgi:hypothetical protein